MDHQGKELTMRRVRVVQGFHESEGQIPGPPFTGFRHCTPTAAGSGPNDKSLVEFSDFRYSTEIQPNKYLPADIR